MPARAFQGSKTEELTRAVVTLFFIFLFSLVAVKAVPFCKDHPFSFPDTPQLRDADYAIVGSSFYSEAMFKDNDPKFWEALRRTLDRQGRLIVWYYEMVTVAAILLGIGSKYYGKLKRYKLYSKIADIYLLPHIAQWCVVLTAFTFPDRKTVAKADVLMTDDTLYQGKVADHPRSRRKIFVPAFWNETVLGFSEPPSGAGPKVSLHPKQQASKPK